MSTGESDYEAHKNAYCMARSWLSATCAVLVHDCRKERTYKTVFCFSTYEHNRRKGVSRKTYRYHQHYASREHNPGRGNDEASNKGDGPFPAKLHADLA